MGEYDSTLGLLLLGVMFNTFLYGIVTYQFVRYCRANVNDWIVFRALIVSVFLVDTMYSAAVIYAIYFLVIENFNNPAILGKPVWQCNSAPLPVAWSAFITQMYLTGRLWRLVASRVLVAIAVVMAVCSFSLAIVAVSHLFAAQMTIRHDVKSIDTIRIQMIIWLAALVVTDCFITGSLCTALLRARTGVGRTDYLIWQFIRGAIQTGVFAGIFSLGCLLAFAFWTETDGSLMFAIPSGRVYTATLLYSLLLRAERNELSEQKDCGDKRRIESPPQQLTSAITIYELNTFDHESIKSSNSGVFS